MQNLNLPRPSIKSPITLLNISELLRRHEVRRRPCARATQIHGGISGDICLLTKSLFASDASMALRRSGRQRSTTETCFSSLRIGATPENLTPGEVTFLRSEANHANSPMNCPARTQPQNPRIFSKDEAGGLDNKDRTNGKSMLLGLDDKNPEGGEC